MVSIALFEPDIPQNTGSLMRLCACMDVALHIIEPCGFVLDEKAVRRVAMDYGNQLQVVRHSSWQRFRESKPGRILLLTTKTDQPYTGFDFAPGDVLLLGRESSGVPQQVVDVADATLTIPMKPPARSLNVALAAAMVLGEALRQTRNT